MSITDSDSIDGLSRRGLLTRSAAGLGIALTGSVSGLFGTAASPAVAHHRRRKIGYGPLIDDPNGLLSLPEGFEYKIVAQSGVTKLESGEPTPSDPDGTAAFVRRGGNGSVLVNNHEISPRDGAAKLIDFGQAVEGFDVPLRCRGARRHRIPAALDAERVRPAVDLRVARARRTDSAARGMRIRQPGALRTWVRTASASRGARSPSVQRPSFWKMLRHVPAPRPPR